MEVRGREAMNGGESRYVWSVFQRVADETTDFFNRERFLHDLPGSKQLGHAEKVPIAGGPGHGDDFRLEKFAREFERHIHAIPFGHENIGNDEISGRLSIEGEPCLPVGGFANLMPILLQDAAQQVPNRVFVVDDENGCHEILSPECYRNTCSDPRPRVQ